MEADPPRDLIACLEDLSDPRRHNARHTLCDIVAIAILAVICGADSAVEIEFFGKSKIKWLSTFLKLPHGIPSHDTFGRVLAALNPDAFEVCFAQWTQTLRQAIGQRRHIAADGKVMRGSVDRANHATAMEMVNAWCCDEGLALGQLGTSGKGKEASTMPKLLSMLNLNGAVVTVDALHCRAKLAQQIVDQGGDFIMQVKPNAKGIYKSVKGLFESEEELAADWIMKTATSEVSHGRIEQRRMWQTKQTGGLIYSGGLVWRHVNSIMMVENQRTLPGAEPQIEKHYYVSSLKDEDPRQMLAWTRGHWRVENQLHWVLDIAFREDACRLRNKYAAENMSRLRRFALNLLKQDTHNQGGIKAKRMRCGWDHDYLIAILTQTTSTFG